jgi:hypothetical protein
VYCSLNLPVHGSRFACGRLNPGIHEHFAFDSGFPFLLGSRAAKLFQDETIRKVHTEWLIPLRPTVAGILSELEKDGSKDANQIMCLLNPVQLVLQRCTELVEEKMKG